jgi:hypothetical protein
MACRRLPTAGALANFGQLMDKVATDGLMRGPLAVRCPGLPTASRSIMRAGYVAALGIQIDRIYVADNRCDA